MSLGIHVPGNLVPQYNILLIGLLWINLSSLSSILFFFERTGKQNLSKTYSNPQNKAPKFMTNTRWRQSASTLYQKLHVLKFNEIVKLRLLLAMIMDFVCNNKFSNVCFDFSRVENFRHYQDRNSSQSNYVPTFARTEKGKSTISFLSQKIWREIPSHPKNLSIKSFNYQYKRQLLNCYA